ncbi:MAG: hypothetical protein R6X02_23650 [Enhygromyxa sp.]
MQVRLEHGGGCIVLRPWYEAEVGVPLVSLAPSRLRALIAEGGAVRASLRALLFELGELGLEGLDDDELAERLAVAIERGRVRAEFERREPMVSVASPEPDALEHEAEPSTVGEREDDWIEVELIGEDDQGIAGVRCVLTLPDGRTLTRTTDRFGLIRVEGIAAGECSISFPELDEEAWEPA